MPSRPKTGAYVLIVIGAIFLLVNLGVLPIREVARLLATWWPLILIAIGVSRLVRPRKGD
jgi:hypothetical protein